MAGRYPVKAVANWFIDRFAQDRCAPTQLQIQKLSYIAHGWHLGMDEDGDGLAAEPVFAWKYGPVFTPLRDEFRDFGASEITRHATDVVDGLYDFTPELEDQEPLEWELGLLSWVYAHYGSKSGPELIELTHRPGTPWHEVTNGGRDVGWKKRIPNDVIRRYYINMMRQEQIF